MLLTNAFMPDPRPYQEALSLIKAGHKVKILCWDRGENLPENEKIKGIEIERIKLASRHGRGTLQIIFLGILWLKILQRSSREELDIIYCHDFDTFPVGLIIKGIKGKKMIFDSHEIYSKMLADNVCFPLKVLIVLLEKILIKMSDWVIVTCSAMAQFYRSYGVKRISIIGNWKNLSDFEISKEMLEKEKVRLGIKDELVISYIANLGPERIIEPLLEAVKEDQSVFLIIGGDGVQRPIVEKAASEVPNIKYLGFVRCTDVSLYTALSSVIYYGYNKDFGMAEFNSPNKLFDALAAGKAFIGGNFGEMGKILREEKCGIALDCFTKDDVIRALKILKDNTRLQIFKNNAKEAALRKYNWINVEKELFKIFSELN